MSTGAISITVRCSAHCARLIDVLVARTPGMTADEVVRRCLRKHRRAACAIPPMVDFGTYDGAYLHVRLSELEAVLAEDLSHDQLRCIVLYHVERAAVKSLRHDAVNAERARIESEQRQAAAQVQLLIARARAKLEPGNWKLETRGARR